MNRQPLDSSNVASVGFEPLDGSEVGTLEVEFHRGGTYAYQHVPASLYHELMTAPSPGRFVRERLKDEYRAERV